MERCSDVKLYRKVLLLLWNYICVQFKWLIELLVNWNRNLIFYLQSFPPLNAIWLHCFNDVLIIGCKHTKSSSKDWNCFLKCEEPQEDIEKSFYKFFHAKEQCIWKNYHHFSFLTLKKFLLLSLFTLLKNTFRITHAVRYLVSAKSSFN